MAIDDYKARVTIPYQSGQATDVTVNTWSFRGDPGVNSLLDLANAIAAFYQDTPSAVGSQRAVGAYLSDTVSRAADAARIDFFQHEVAGAPLQTNTFTIPPRVGGTGLLPTEVAAVLSFHADYANQDSTERARRRGRIFLGPLDRTSGEETAGVQFRPSAQFRNDVTNAAAEFLGLQAIADGWTWAVYSPTDDVGRAVTLASMDDAYDTIRSRGPDPIARTIISV